MTRWWRSLLVGAGVAGLLTVAVPGAASACSCVTAELADQLAFDGIGVAFTGIPDRVDAPTGPVFSSSDLQTWTFTVDTVYRGSVPRTTEVRTAMGEASCGVTFVADRRALVLARTDETGVAVASLCDGSRAVDELTADDLALLGPGAPPADVVATPVVDPTPGVWSSPTSWVVAAVLGTAVAGVVLVAVRRRPDR